MGSETPASEAGWSEEISRLFIDIGRYIVPERDRQMQAIAALLSYLPDESVILEICCGEGLLAEVLLDSLPGSVVHGLDGSVEMLQRARERLARFGHRFQCSRFNLAARDWRRLDSPVNAIVSSLAIHHLTELQKPRLFSDLCGMLADNGAVVIADIVEHQNDSGSHLAAQTWDEVVRERALELDGNTETFDFFQREGWNTFWYLDPEDIDKPSPLFDQLKWLEDAGSVDIDVHWMLAGHAIFGARKR